MLTVRDFRKNHDIKGNCVIPDWMSVLTRVRKSLWDKGRDLLFMKFIHCSVHSYTIPATDKDCPRETSARRSKPSS